jgi:hypothetical protein
LRLNKYLLENPIVHGDHDDSWYPEGNRARHNCIDFVDDKYAFSRILFDPLEMFFRRIPSEEDWRKGDKRREKPDVGNHETDGFLRHVERIFQRSAYCKISARKEEKIYIYDESVFMNGEGLIG